MHQTAKAFTISGFEQCLIDAKGSCVATVDEIAENLLAKILCKKSMSAELAMKTFLMELSGQEDDSAPFALLKRARNGGGNPVLNVVQEIPGASFTLIGASTPTKFYEALTGGVVADGFLNRFLILEGDPQPRTRTLSRKQSPCQSRSSMGCRPWRPRDISPEVFAIPFHPSAPRHERWAGCRSPGHIASEPCAWRRSLSSTSQVSRLH